jgi:hypothetical protein
MTPGGLGCGVSVDSGGESLRVGGEPARSPTTTLNSPTEALDAGRPGTQRAMAFRGGSGVDPTERTQLVTGGPFAVARNPIFTP